MNFKHFLLIIPIFLFLTLNTFAASQNIIVEEINLIERSENVVVDNNNGINVTFNDLNQYAQYEVTLKNNTDKNVFVNELKVDNSSQDFIHYVLDDDSVGIEIESGKSSKVKMFIKTLEIEGAGRNTNDNINLRILLNDNIKNPNTKSSLEEMLFSLFMLFCLFIFYKKNKQKFIAIFLLMLFVCNMNNVFADDVLFANINGTIKYDSQIFLKKPSVSIVNWDYPWKSVYCNYDNSTLIWKYSDKIKNVYISSLNSLPEQYEYYFDLSEDNKKRINAYLIKEDSESQYFDLYIYSKGIIYAPSDVTGLFSFPNVEKIEGIENIDFKNTTNMNGMFLGNEKLKYVNYKSIDMSSVVHANYMFYNCTSLDINNSKLNVDKIKYKEMIYNNHLYDVISSTKASNDSKVDFSKSPISGLYVVSDTINNKFPIYYYRGEQDNNNVIFGGMCWKIVRTTDSGGIKLLYSGHPTYEFSDRGGCYSTAGGYIGNNAFNSSIDGSPSYSGYMQGDKYVRGYKLMENNTDAYIYGNDISYKNGKYTLSETIASSDYINEREKLASKYHYTCFNDSGICEEVYYIHHFDINTVYYLTFKDGEDLDAAKSKMFANKSDSTVKYVIDRWYKNNLISYEKYIEDTVWCNDRSIYSGALLSKDSSGLDYSYFNAYYRNFVTFKPSLKCSNKNDRFTVDKANGNGDLTYPVGLLTADEMTLAGHGKSGYNTKSYLTIETILAQYWSMSPYAQTGVSAHGIAQWGGMTYGGTPTSSYKVRPSISLKNSAKIKSGNGSEDFPYVILTE